MQSSQQSSSRKKFLIWSVIMISSATVIKFFSGPEKKKKDTVKMLTREGRLVEIDRKLIHSSKRNMITDPELKAWVKK